MNKTLGLQKQYFFITLILLFSVSALAQRGKSKPHYGNYNFQNIYTDSSLTPALDTFAIAPNGSIAFKNHMLFVKDSTWKPLGYAGSLSDSLLTLDFTVGDSLAPGIGDSLLTHPDFINNVKVVYREGDYEHPDSLTGVTFPNDSTIAFHPHFYENEKIHVDVWKGINKRVLSLHTLSSPAGYDTDAQAYFDAQGVINSSSKTNFNNFVLAAKSGTNYWPKIKAIYAGYGNGLVNAKSPGTFNATATNAPTVDAYGYLFDGVNDALNTNITASSNLATDKEFHAFYIKSSTDDKPVAGAIDAGNGTYIFPRSGGHLVYRLQTGSDKDGGTNASAVGTWVFAKRQGITPLIRVTKNGTQVDVNGTATIGLSTYSIYIGALNNSGTIGSFNACRIGIYIIGDDLTDAQMNQLSTDITNFITAEGRN